MDRLENEFGVFINSMLSYSLVISMLSTSLKEFNYRGLVCLIMVHNYKEHENLNKSKIALYFVKDLNVRIGSIKSKIEKFNLGGFVFYN